MTRSEVAALRPQDQPISIREGRFKLAWNPGQIADGSPSGEALLFDLVVDPGETTDVAAAHPDVHERLSRQLHAWFESVKAEPGSFGHAMHVLARLPAPIRGDQPVQLVGDLSNSVGGLYGWRSTGARAHHEVEATEARRVVASLRWHAAPPAGVRFRLAVEGRAGAEAVTDGSERTLFPDLEIPAGASVVSPELIEVPNRDGVELHLFEIELDEAVKNL